MNKSLSFCSLNSGSNGNCYYIGTANEAILIDAGLSCRETERRMKRLNLSMTSVKAIFISHEHTDHVKGLPLISKKHQIPVYITHATLSNCRFNLEKHLHVDFTNKECIKVGNFEIVPFNKFHDAIHPHSFVIHYHQYIIGVFTDLGQVCQNLVDYFSQCHVAFLETNYCEEMLEQGRYPIFLKNRIRGGKGHLSNTQALNLFLNHRPAHLQHLLLSHLSNDNNSAEKVLKMFTDFAGNTKISVASRHQESEVFFIPHQPVPHYTQTSFF